MLRTTGRLLAVTAATVSAAAALQGTALAGPGETFGLAWGNVGATCYDRSVTVSVSSPDPNEYIQFQLSVTVGTTTTRGTMTTVLPQHGGPVGPVTVSVKDCGAATGQAAVYDVWVNGYKNALAAPDYVFDQAHGYSVCDTPAAAGCTDTPVAAPVITRTPVA